MEYMTIGRRQFTLQAVLAMLSGVAISVSGCGSSSESPTSPSPTPGATADITGAISANHGHTAVITAAQLTSRNSITLNIQGTSTHPHTVELSAADVTAVANRQQLAKTSSTDNGHSHTVTFN